MSEPNEQDPAFPEAWGASRLPGEQWLAFDTPEIAEAYLVNLAQSAIKIHREPFPNATGLYARIQLPDRIPEDKVFVL